MGKQQTSKENPLLSKSIPSAPPLPANQAAPKEKQNGETVSDGTIHQNCKTVILQDTGKPQETVKQQSSNTAKREKITFYLEPGQADKLYDFVEAFRKRTGVKINQQDMLRRIIDVITIDAIFT